ncbi:bifunctional diguanylate cyclase/phosphodiesterase [Luteimonas vadosa]|uniref:Bifunctional diguanylate cyclase/phosphodiesterase n=1 Tax=Luteimonas vadosa TaxID=1165507 RepID=A0ABP9E6E1_9GAMM
MDDLHDRLTGLPDRRGFLSLLRRHIGYANDRRNLLALVVVDIDHFAQINGTSGYAFGDEALVHLGVQLKSVARKYDHVGRIGDNRFALLLPTVLNPGHAELAVQKLFRLLEVPLQSPEGPVCLAITAGAALCPVHATHPEYLLRVAEMTLASARLQGRKYLFAEDQARTMPLSDLWDLELNLANALERGELCMHYQPQVRLSDMAPCGVEALMRWNSPTRGQVSPSVFMPIADRMGLTRKMTLWALNTVLRQAAQWEHDWGPLTMSLNVPGSVAGHMDLPEQVDNALNLWRSEKVKLVLEITEDSLMERDRSTEILQRIRDLGVTISIDDFGTGYSCLAYFRNLPVDELKIDRSFVSDLLSDRASADITSLIIDLAHRFGMSVVGEGIEDAGTLEALRAAGCDVAQGYFFGKPMPPQELQAWLRSYAPGSAAAT